jgi:serine/threonine-protein kinase
VNTPYGVFNPRLAEQKTQAYQGNLLPAPQTQRRCHVALVGGSGPHITAEVSTLLRHRLALASLVLTSIFSLLLVRNLLLDTDELEYHCPHSLGLQLLALFTNAVLAGLLWSKRELCPSSLRYMELAMFGVVAAFVGWLEWVTFHNGRVLMHAAPGNLEPTIHDATLAASLRWFALLVIYGTFIPNTWRRCLIVVTVLALTPLIICVAAALSDPTLTSHLLDMLADLAIPMGIGAVVSVFGSYKIAALRAEAFEARRLGQYQLKKRLGKGGMGEVYLAEHLLLRRPCAIKLIRPDQAGDPNNLNRFEREVRATAALTHWNTIEIFDYGRSDDGTFYYVMEYLPGLSLQDLVEQYGPLPPQRALHFLQQVCRALREAHANGLIHRDIKPSNIIACERGKVYDVAKLLDFGLVQHHTFKQDETKLTIQGTILGSPAYMSPEQAMGKSDLDARTDIYSLGAVAYFLLTGQPPFVRDTAMQLLLAHGYEAALPLRDVRPELSEDLQTVVLRCLEKDPSKRFADAGSLEKALGLCRSAGLWTDERAASWWSERTPKPQVADVSPQQATEPAVA